MDDPRFSSAPMSGSDYAARLLGFALGPAPWEPVDWFYYMDLDTRDGIRRPYLANAVITLDGRRHVRIWPTVGRV